MGVRILYNEDEQCNDNKLCNEHGTCYIVFFIFIKKSFGTRDKYCVCQAGYYGTVCEKTFIAPDLSPEELLFCIFTLIKVPINSLRVTGVTETDKEKCKPCTQGGIVLFV